MTDPEKKLDSGGNPAGQLSSATGKSEEPQQVPGELLEKLPKGVKEVLQFMSISGPVPNPLIGKITPEHIEKLIVNDDKENERDFQDSREERSHNFKIFIVAIIAVLLLTGFLTIMKERDILLNVIMAILGFAGGFGVGKYFQNE